MSAFERSVEVLPVPDFLEQLAGSFGVGREEAHIILGQLLTSYEPSWRCKSQSSAADGNVGNRLSPAA